MTTQRFSRAITRTPSDSLVRALSTAGLGTPNPDLARQQHSSYIEALCDCGLQVTVLPEDEHADSTFVEDLVLCTRKGAILTRPGAETRRGEIEGLKPTIDRYFEDIQTIIAPGTLDAGDVMMVGDHFYIGLSARTNSAGAMQAIRYLEGWGLSAETVLFKGMLHLKSGVAYLHNETVLISEKLSSLPAFQKFKKLIVPAEEAYAANAVWVNDQVFVAAGHPVTEAKVRATGYSVISLDMSEFEKADGGLSCLSLRF